MASALNLAGVLSGTAVAETIGKDLIDPSAVDLLTVRWSHGRNHSVVGGLSSFAIPGWVMGLCASVMALGTMTGGWRIMKTMGMKISRLQTHQGFAAEMAAASTIELATRMGVPLSMTHTISTAIMGVCAVRRSSAVHWNVIGQLLNAWILTFPTCGLINWCVVKLFRVLF
jgi:PiT family inorganic phosphate transporter